MLLTVGVFTPPAEGSASDASCPELTDSVDRLYAAYFLRAPDAAGHRYWVDRYASGQRNLRQIAEFFAESSEFQSRYGALDNADFVQRVYSNVLDRQPDPSGEAFWIGRLDGGMSRGALMIGFSESVEFVTKTKTNPPLAGFGRIYPVGTTFACGSGSVVDRLVTGDRTMGVDVFGINTDPRRSQNLLAWVGTSSTPTSDLIANEVVRPNEYVLLWNGEFRITAARPTLTVGMPAGRAGVAATSTALKWIVVAYPSPMPPDRPGWQDAEPRQLR